MYLYCITNNINKKKYIGITNNVQKRWGNERSYPSNPAKRQVIQEAIHKYGSNNFIFEIVEKGLGLEEAVQKKQALIKKENTLVPNGYNVHPGGTLNPHFASFFGAKNPNARLTQEEAQYILNNRNKPMCLLYEEFQDKISYEAFKNIYHHKTYTDLLTSVEVYPYNIEFSNQFTSGPLEYDEVVKIRERYQKGEYWRNVWEDYKWAYKNEWSFWNVYNGNCYKLVMPEVFTEENKKKHSGLGHVGEKNIKAKLTENDVINIRAMWKSGKTRKEIYDLYPQVTTTSIRSILNNKTWTYLL